MIANINNQLTTYLNQSATSYGSSSLYKFQGGTTSIVLRQPSDTSRNVYSTSTDLASNTVHSLFLTGTTDAPEVVLVRDNLPDHGSGGHSAADSTTGIRFINLSSGTTISVNLATNANGSEVASLNYKSITDFKNYAATSDITDYTFEFRDAATGDVLATYTLSNVGFIDPYTPNTVRFKNLTLVFAGLSGEQTAFSVPDF